MSVPAAYEITAEIKVGISRMPTKRISGKSRVISYLAIVGVDFLYIVYTID